MANEMFTTRSGKQIPVASYSVLPEHMVSIMRLQEDFAQRGEHLSLHGVMLDIFDKGIRQIRNQWKNGDLSKNRRDFAKAVAPYMVNPAKYAAEIVELAKRHGLTNCTSIEMSTPAEEPSEEELEEATKPSAK